MTKTKDTIEGLELLKKENKVIWERQKILNRNKDVLFINFEDTDNWLSQAIEWGKALDQAEGELPEECHVSEHYKHPIAKAKQRDYDDGFNECRKQSIPILAKAKLRIEELEKKYSDLIMAVGNKYPDETRHQTALRYILNAEKGADGTGKQS